MNMSEEKEIRKIIKKLVAISKRSRIDFAQLSEYLKEEWEDSSLYLEESKEERNFRKKVENFLEKNEDDEEWRKFEVEIICTGYELYNQQEKIDTQAISKRVILSKKISNENISKMRWSIQNCRREGFDYNKFQEELSNLRDNYSYRHTMISNFVIWSIAIIKSYNS